MPDAFTEQTVQERAAFLEPSDLRVFFCYFQVFNSQCFSKLFGDFHSVFLGFINVVGISFHFAIGGRF